jgi:hypothetical protein
VRTAPAALLAIALGAALGGPPARAAGATAGPACSDARLESEILASLRARRFLDAHVLARTLEVLCPDAPGAARWRTYDALALVELDESARARELLLVAEGAPDPAASAAARLLRAWVLLRDRDHEALAQALAALPAGGRARLDALAAADDPARFARAAAGLPPDLRAGALAAATQLWVARGTRRPWLAASLSAVLPGAGQVYAGSWQGAAVAFALNAILIGATVELAYRRFYVTSAAAGLAASFFYVGNIVNAADLAHRRNDMAADPAWRRLEEQLVPEAHP